MNYLFKPSMPLNAGWFANALGKLNPKKHSQTNSLEELAEKPKPGKWVKWPRRGSCTRAR